MGLNLRAGDAADVRVNSITLTSEVDAADGNVDFVQGCDPTDGGAESNVRITDILTSAKLMNGATQVGTTKSPTTADCAGNGGQLQFNNLNLTILKGQSVVLTLSGNLSSSLTTAPDRIRFVVEANGDVTSQDAEGNDVDVDGAPVTGNAMTIQGAGALTVALAPNDTESEAGIVVGGASAAVLAKYRFTAQNEELQVTKLRLTMDPGAVSGVSSLTLWDGSTQVGGPVSPDSNGEADFSGVNFTVAKDGSKTMTVKATLNSVGPSGAASGLNLQLTLEGQGGENFEARGTSSSTRLTEIGDGLSDYGANNKVLRKTKVTVSNAALSSLTLGDGDKVVSRFTLTADAAGQVSVKSLEWTLSVAGGLLSLDNPRLREVGVGTDIPADDNAPACVAGSCTVALGFDDELTVSAGSSKTYELHMDVTGSVGGDSVSTILTGGDSTLVTGELDSAAGLSVVNGDSIDDMDGTDNQGTFNFVWSDNSSIPHNDVIASNVATDDAAASNDWTNGWLVKILPNDSQTLTN